MKTLQLPGQLIASLTELGLLESEAKIYAALVLLGYADVSDLLEILDVSKPRIYTSLGTLEERGLIVQTSPRPAIYQAIAPDIALEMIVNKYEDAKKEAVNQFKIAKKLELTGKTPPPLYYIFGNKSLEFKINDMLENARESVYCQTSEQYLKYVEKLAKKDIKLRLMVKSENPKLRKQLENLFKNGDAQIGTFNNRHMMNQVGPAGEKTWQQMSSRSEKMDMENLIDMENMMILVVDDSESLMILPIKSDSLSAINSTNKAMVFLMRQGLERSFSQADITGD
jgi:sugar-specific transcriptional regulator TrmB